MKVVMASNNAHKIAELRAILSAYGLDVVSQREAGVHVEPEETGTTFEENSRIKAVAVMQACPYVLPGVLKLLPLQGDRFASVITQGDALG